MVYSQNSVPPNISAGSVGEFYKNLIKKGPVLILRDNTIIIHINLLLNLMWHLCNEKHISASILEKTKKSTTKTLGRRNGHRLLPL